METDPNSESRDDFANPDNTTTDDNEESRERSTNVDDKQVDEGVDLLSRSIESSNDVHKIIQDILASELCPGL